MRLNIVYDRTKVNETMCYNRIRNLKEIIKITFAVKIGTVSHRFVITITYLLWNI